RHRIRIILRRADDDAELLVGKRRELGGEAIDGAAMADDAFAVDLADEEAEPEAGLLVLLGELDLVHRFERFLLENLLAVGPLAAGEEELEELRHVVDTGVEVAGRVHAELPR